jgi:hypothetical protein
VLPVGERPKRKDYYSITLIVQAVPLLFCWKADTAWLVDNPGECKPRRCWALPLRPAHGTTNKHRRSQPMCRVRFGVRLRLRTGSKAVAGKWSMLSCDLCEFQCCCPAFLCHSPSDRSWGRTLTTEPAFCDAYATRKLLKSVDFKSLSAQLRASFEVSITEKCQEDKHNYMSTKWAHAKAAAGREHRALSPQHYQIVASDRKPHGKEV